MPLKEYKRKRKFSLTPEPKAITSSKVGNSFVVQRHDASHLHYDFRLEMDGVLKSWAVPKGPPKIPGEKRLAVMVEDHPLEYGKFHGTIPKGQYGAGTVEIWDKGTYELFAGSLKSGEIKFILNGDKLKGEYVLVHFGKDKDKKNWLFLKHKKEIVSSNNIKQSAFSKKDPFPHEIKPMLATLIEKPFDDQDWLYETKWDGYRAIAEIEKGKVSLYSRNNLKFNQKYPEIVTSLQKINHDAILDGEIVALDEKGIPSFQLLQDYRLKQVSLVYIVFDLLYLNGKDLRNVPLIDRKSILKDLLPKDRHLMFSDHIDKEGKKLFDLAKRKGYEGIIAKKKDSQYLSIRSEHWQKIKNIQNQEAVIAGFTLPRGSRKEFGALVLGIYDQGKLKYIGHTGGGFDQKKLAALIKLLKPLITKNSPFETTPKTNMPATWVKPRVVVEVKFSEWTKEGIMRQPIYLALRPDKKATEVIKEQIFPPGESKPESEYPNLNKIFWPKEKYTKGDVIEYYKKISEIILPYLKDRPQSLNRHPDGINGESFFQKDISHPPSWAKVVPIYSESEDKNINWLICNDQKTLLYMANLGCIEINPWNSRYQTKDNPDYLILDLDPHKISWEQVKKVALEIKGFLDELKVDAFIKTSGISGIHVLLPLNAKYNYDQTKQFAELLASKIRDRIPKITSIERNPKKREKKVYLDFLQNRLGQTIAAPYCLRPVPLAPVSTPLEWKELKTNFKPEDFNLKTIFKRLAKKNDLWKDLMSHPGIDLLKTLDKLT